MTSMWVSLAAGWAIFSIGSTLVAAPEQGRPGELSPAYVWVQNRGPEQAVPVILQGTDSATPLRVLVTGTTPTRVENVVSTQRVRQVWEYRELTIVAGGDLARELNEAGAEGWEATAVHESVTPRGARVVLVKRPRQP